MKRKVICFLGLIVPLLCTAQINLSFVYEYDNAGNRTVRKVINLLMTPPAPSDSLQELEASYYVENMDQVEIKIYPNPATEVVKLEITNFDNFNKGIFRLYNLNGQLLQEHSVHSSATEVDLSKLAKGTYILKVQINDRVEDWKIVKQ